MGVQRTLLIVFLSITGCASVPRMSEPENFTSETCRDLFQNARYAEVDVQLDQVSELYRTACYEEVVVMATHIRKHRRDKEYSITGEALEVFVPEGTVTPYVLESYERSLLSIMISLSYLSMGKEEAALVELRRSHDEERAVLYNHGSDPVLTMLQASLWDRFDPEMGRPLWKSLSEMPEQGPGVVNFAKLRLKQIDKGGDFKRRWKIFGYGQRPELDWKNNFFEKKNPYKIFAKSKGPDSCSDSKSVLISTSSWDQKTAARYDHGYHPWLVTKSLIRVPVGLFYGIVGISGGIAVGVGGCYLDFAVEGKGEACGESLKLAGLLIGKSADLVGYTLKPDLRRWKKLPMAFYITSEELPEQSTKCLSAELQEAGKFTFL